MNQLMIFAYNENDKPNPAIAHKGFFDGREFIPRLGFCSSVDELYDYDYIQIFADDGCRVHSPKKYYNDDLQVKMRKVFVDAYGEFEQSTLF